MAFRPSDRDSRNRGQNDYNDRLLEFQNDDAMDSLHGKISALKNITIEMHDDVSSQNNLLSDMGSTFDSASDKLRGSMRKMTTMISAKHGRHTWSIVGLSMVLFIVIWFMFSRAGSSATP
ncbi:hypothetical protein BDZ88DRAFT_413263 [Geranomyces variabilis]|nr:hypothetical protein BDZ88DRAFT_413263 [Geranomyces variabilis]